MTKKELIEFLMNPEIPDDCVMFIRDYEALFDEKAESSNAHYLINTKTGEYYGLIE